MSWKDCLCFCISLTYFPQFRIWLYRLFLLLIILHLTGLKYPNHVDSCTSSENTKRKAGPTAALSDSQYTSSGSVLPLKAPPSCVPPSHPQAPTSHPCLPPSRPQGAPPCGLPPETHHPGANSAFFLPAPRPPPWSSTPPGSTYHVQTRVQLPPPVQPQDPRRPVSRFPPSPASRTAPRGLLRDRRVSWARLAPAPSVSPPPGPPRASHRSRAGRPSAAPASLSPQTGCHCQTSDHTVGPSPLGVQLRAAGPRPPSFCPSPGAGRRAGTEWILRKRQDCVLKGAAVEGTLQGRREPSLP